MLMNGSENIEVYHMICCVLNMAFFLSQTNNQYSSGTFIFVLLAFQTTSENIFSFLFLHNFTQVSVIYGATMFI
jgi:hypothetical protein